MCPNFPKNKGRCREDTRGDIWNNFMKKIVKKYSNQMMVILK